VASWSNGGYSEDPSNPDYGTHDWIAQHALDWLPTEEKQYILDNLAAYLYGTELPDNPEGIGDTIKHHIYYWSNESLQDDVSAVRAYEEYHNALDFLRSGDLVNASKSAGIMSHYIVDVAVFGHVMGAATDWGPEYHHSDYESYVNLRTDNYEDEFNMYLSFDGELVFISAYHAAKELAYDTTFDVDGDLTCIWMDENYNWGNPTFKDRAGESLNLAVNYLADVLHTLYSVAHEIGLGALLPLTGALATFGEDDLVAAEFAVEEVNALFEHMGVDRTLSLFVEDTQTNPDVALEKVEYLAAMGIELLVGPISSPEVRAIKDYCDANEILAISHGSTAPDLAVPDDYIFRFSAQEGLGQGPAIGRMMYDDGKRYVIPVTRNDSWGVALEEAVELKFEGLGGTFLGGIRYQPGEMDFSDEAFALAEIVGDAVLTYGAGQVAVLHLSLAEVNAFMTACLAYPVLNDVKWYGSEGTCRNGAMLEDPNVRDFAMSVRYPCTQFGPMHSDKWEKVRQHCNATLGRAPEPYAYNVYDIVWVYALSLLEVDAYDSRAFKTVLPTVTRNYFGASGWIELDENGDRKGADYDIWQIAEIATDEYAWVVVGRYIFATDSLVWSPFTLTPVYVFEPVWNRRIFYVVTESNSTVSDYYFNPEEGPVIRFDVAGPNGTTGFCRVAIPKRLLWVEERNWTVLVDGDPVEVTVIEEGNYYTHLYFVYSHSAKTVQIMGTHVVGERSPIVSTESTGDSREPSLAVDSNGNVHVAWQDVTNYGGSGADIDIFYKRFVPGWGWTITEVVSTNSTTHSRQPSLAVDSSGNVHIAWHDWTNYTGCGTDADIFYKRYEVGVGWTLTQVVSTESTAESYQPSLAVDSNGNVHVAWRDWTNYAGCGIDSDIFYKRYEVGVGWTITEVVSTNSTAESYQPSLAVDSSGNVHIAWDDSTNYAGCGIDSDIFYRRYEVGVAYT